MRRDPDRIARQLRSGDGRLLFAGPTGNGKTTLAHDVAAAAADEPATPLRLLDADPGSPGVGPPGAVALARRADAEWTIERLAGVATLDAGRFRLPVALAAERLANQVEGPLLIDGPGLHRGTPATELMPALARTTGADRAVIVGDEEEQSELADALRAQGVALEFADPHPEATAPSLAVKARRRTALWEEYLDRAPTEELALDQFRLAGTAPPLEVRDAWPGRQVALLDAGGATLAMGGVESIESGVLRVRAPNLEVDEVATVVARDARRNDEGRLRTESDRREAEAEETGSTQFTPTTSPNQRAGLDATLTMRVGLFRVRFVGAFFDDPTLLLEGVQHPRRLLFDLGEVQRYPVRVLNKVSDVFVTHAHTDHFAGFVRLIRTRVHDGGRCRVFGPRGLADRVESLVDGFTWDRLGTDEGPVFEVCELRGDRLHRWEIRAGGRRRRELGAREAPDGRLLREPRFTVRARQLDHGTPVLAFALEEAENYTVRSDRLGGDREPGPWLGELKRRYARRELEASIELPGGSTETVEALAEEFLIASPGETFVYATDFADTSENREKVIELARGAELFVCEAFYAEDDADAADRYGHLTTTACAEIARDADVGNLVPVHFSSRYDSNPERLFGELVETFDRVELPGPIARRLARRARDGRE